MANRVYLFNSERLLRAPHLLHEAGAEGPGRWVEVADWARAIPVPWMLAFRRGDAQPYSHPRVAEDDEGSDEGVIDSGYMLNAETARARANLRDALPLLERMTGDARRARRYLDAALAAFASLELPNVALHAGELVDGDNAAFLAALDGTPTAIAQLQRYSGGFECGFGPIPYPDEDGGDEEGEESADTASPGEAHAQLARKHAEEGKPALAFQALIDAANAGNAPSAYFLGLIYQGPMAEVLDAELFTAPEVQLPDHEKSRYWLRKAVDRRLSEPLAYLLLGEMAFNGVPAPQDHADAVRWFRHAAEAGSSKAMVWMAIACYHGFGTKRDHAAAARWAQRAAMEGDTVGQFAFGLLCYQGHGLAKDLVEGHKCMSNAAGRGFEPAIRFLATPAWKFWARRGFLTGLS